MNLRSVPAQAGSPHGPSVGFGVFFFQLEEKSDLCDPPHGRGETVQKKNKSAAKLPIVRASREQIPGEGGGTCH